MILVEILDMRIGKRREMEGLGVVEVDLCILMEEDVSGGVSLIIESILEIDLGIGKRVHLEERKRKRERKRLIN
jgi:hypothetical protein